VLLSVVAAGGAAGAAAAWKGIALGTMTGATLTVVLLPYLLVASPGFAALLARLARRPAVPAAVLCAIGLTTVLGGFIWFDLEDERQIDADMTALMSIESHPPLFTPRDVQAHTDQGTPVPLRAPVDPRSQADSTANERALASSQVWGASVIRTHPAADASNCHGWIFTGGRYWIEGVQVDAILQENGYVPVAKPQHGDLVIYRDEPGVCHSALVRYVVEGQPILVEGKWGALGTYLHRVDESVYGSNFTYYRSPRKGHVLAGLDSPGSADPTSRPALNP
jgi:hypothetical protein